MITVTGPNQFKQASGGTFEDEAETWGIHLTSSSGGNDYMTLERSFDIAHEGNYSAKATILFAPSANFEFIRSDILADLPPVKAGNLYILRGWVYVPSSAPLGSNQVDIWLNGESINNGQLQTHFTIPLITPKVSDCLDKWAEMQWAFYALTDGFFRATILIHSNGGTINPEGLVYFDDFTFYEMVQEPPELTDLSKHYFSKNPITFLRTSEVEADAVTAELFIEPAFKSGEFEKVAEQELTVDEAGEALFYFEELLTDYLKPELPAHSLNSITRAVETIKRAQVYFYDNGGSPLGDNEHFLALLGGIQKEVYPGFDYFNTFLPDKKKFLTWQPVSKKIAEDQDEYLFFLLWKNTAIIKLFAELHYDDDSKQTFEIYSYNTAKVGEVYIMPAGFVQLALATKNPAKNVACYQLYLKDNAEEISERRQYLIDENYFHFTRFFLFHNSLGGFDTLRTTGKAALSMNIDKEISQRVLDKDYEAEKGEMFISDVSYSDEYEVSTGFISLNYLNYLREILISKAVFLIENGVRIPIVLDARSVKIWEEGDFNYFLRFKFTRAYNNRVLTTILNDSLKPCPVVERPRAWRAKQSTQYCIQS